MQLSSRVESEEGMERKEIIDGLKDLIKDRESFITEGEPESWKTDTDKIFEHDKQVLEEAINTIEAQQQEIDILNMGIAELRESNQALKAYAENADADKDEQAGRLMLLNDGIKQVIKWLTPHPSDGSRAVEKARLHLITLIGGKEDA
jgi:hypothetical protein